MVAHTRKVLASLFASALLFAGLAGPASAQPLVQGGLVNVAIGDVTILENVNVGLGLTAAANICDVNVNVLAVQLREGAATCEADSGDVTITQAAG